MSQPVGYEYKSRIPSFSDDADITEALKVYHYGVDNWTTETIPDDSIEGNFRKLNISIANINSQLSSLNYVELVSQTSSPNVVTGQSTSTVPITIRAIASQTAALQQWQNASSVNVGSVSTGGFANFAGYITVGTTDQVTTTGVNIVLGTATHKGIVVKGYSGQSANLQEWISISDTILARVDSTGKIFSNNIEVVTLTQTQTLSNKTLVSPSLTGTPTAITATNTTNSTQIATTQYVKTAIGTLEINSRSSNYTAALSDIGKLIVFNSGSTFTIPTNSSVAFPIGSSFSVMQASTSTLTISPASGVTLNYTPGNRLRTRFSVATLTKTATDEWLLFGDLMI